MTIHGKRTMVGVALCALLSALPSGADSIQDPCSSDLGLEDYINQLLGEDSPVKQNARGIAKAITAGSADAAMRRPRGEGAGGGGLDLYRKFFVGLDLGSVSSQDGVLTFSLRPDLLDLGGLGALALQAVVRDPSLYGPLEEALNAIPEGVGADRREELDAELDDRDDIEYRLRWTLGGREPGAVASRLAAEIFESSWESAARPQIAAAASRIADAVDILSVHGAVDGTTPLREVCAISEEAKNSVIEVVTTFTTEQMSPVSRTTSTTSGRSSSSSGWTVMHRGP